MARKWRLLIVPALAFLVSGLAISAAGAMREDSASEAASRATVKVAQSKLGRILVDGRGRTLYLFTVEKGGSIACTTSFSNCPQVWPPLRTTGKPRAGAGADARLLGSVRRTQPAGLQVTYNRHPLYFYIDDRKPGDTEGQGFGQVWYVVSAKGTAIKK